MNTRFKIAAALGLALATGFAGVASAQTNEPANTKTAPTMTQSAPTKASTLPKKTVALKAHRAHVGHRATMIKHAKVAAHMSRQAKLTHKLAFEARTNTAKAGLLRKHIAKSKGVYARHAMNRSAPATVIR